MILLDLALIIVIVVSVLLGAYRGFVVSALKTASFFVSWILAYLLHPLLSWAMSGQGMMQTLINYTEGAAKLPYDTPLAIITTPITQVDAATLNDLVNNSSLVSPFGNLVKSNIASQAFASQGLTTVGDYFNYTVAYATLNIITFLILFFVFRIICGVIINATDATHKFPVLRHNDVLAGSLTGLLRGVFACYIVMALAPVALSILNVPVVTDYVLSAPLAGFFYKSNFILLLMRGKVF